MTTVKELKRYSIRCDEGMLVTDERGKGVTEISIPERFLRTFCTSNGKLAFFDDNGKLYVTLWTLVAHGILENAGYTRHGFKIPFDDGKIPFDEEQAIKFRAMFK